MKRAPRLFIASVWISLSIQTFATAQQKEVYQGSELRTAHGTGVLVSSTQRANGQEILRIRASREAIASFLSSPLPAQMEAGRSINYPFSLEITPTTRQAGQPDCGIILNDIAAFEACFAATTPRQLGPWHVIQLPSTLPDIAYVGVRLIADQRVFGRCGVVTASRAVLSCDFIFEQGNQIHRLDTSNVALDHFEQFHCAALSVRNSVWPKAPDLPEICRKPQ